MTLKICEGCEYKRAMGNKKKGVRIPDGYGKCIQPGGHCDPDVVSGGIGNPDVARSDTGRLWLSQRKTRCKHG